VDAPRFTDVDAEAKAARSETLNTLKQIARARQRLVSGSATDRELTSAVDASVTAAVDCTNRIIQLSIEVH